MGGGVKSRLVKESVEYLRQKVEKATALKCAQFINSLLLQLQARVATSLSSDSQILWKKPTPAAQLLTLHCTVLDAASGKQQALDYRGGEDDRVQSLSAFIRVPCLLSPVRRHAGRSHPRPSRRSAPSRTLTTRR